MFKDYFVHFCNKDVPGCPNEQYDAECFRASNTHVLLSAAKSVLQNSLISVFLAPAVGSWSDVLGRKPFQVTLDAGYHVLNRMSTVVSWGW